MDEKVDLNQLTSTTIDDILDEIEENEEKEINQTNINLAINWDETIKEIRDENITYIKNLITSNNININEQNALNGKTLLMYAVIIGNFALVQAICNFGVDVHVKDNDGDDALDYAMKYGRYKITELLYYQQLSGKLGKDLKNIATQMHEKNKEAQLMKKIRKQLLAESVKFIQGAIKDRLPFGSDLLYYAWWRVLESDNALKSELWQQMMATFESILCDTSDKNGWKWLKTYFINSLIWYLPHPQNAKSDNNDSDDGDDGDDMENVLKNTLFYELLIRVRIESKKQSDILLKDKINKIKINSSSEWKELISYNINTKYSKNARQDLCGCLIPKYTKIDLSESRYPPSTHFNAQKHYDKNIYLNELLFTANIIDSSFQSDMKLITEDISSTNNLKNVSYRAGPVKTLTRSQTKVENDYINEDYPTSAKILDINRCAIQFKTIKDMMIYLKLFINKINKKNARSIIEVIRVKNGWSIYNENYPQYTDIKLNVLVKSMSDPNRMIIAELQFLLHLMSDFKKVSHKLYAIERKFEFIYNFGKLQQNMNKFKDNNNRGIINGALAGLTCCDIKYFKDLWCLIKSNETALFPDCDILSDNVWDTAIINIICNDNRAEINAYLQEYFGDGVYLKIIIKYIKKYGKKYAFNKMLKSIGSDDILTRIICKMGDLARNNILETLLRFKDKGDKRGKNRASFIKAICLEESKYCKSLKALLNINYKLVFCASNDAFICWAQHGSNDRKLILNFFNKSVLERITSRKFNKTTKVIQLILNDIPVITVRDKRKLFIKNILTISQNICKSGQYGGYNNHLFVILDYLQRETKENTKSRILKLLKSSELRAAYSPTLTIQIYHRYFIKNKYFLLKQLKKYKLFEKICKEHKEINKEAWDDKGHQGITKYIKELEFILTKSPLNDKDKLYLINSMNNKKYGILYDDDYVYDSCVELIKYVKNDTKKLLKFLCDKDKNGKTCFINIYCTKYSNRKILQLINQSLSINDINKLWLFEDENRNTLLYYLFTSSESEFPEETETREATQILGEVFGEKPRFLMRLLHQKVGSNKECILFCKRRDVMEKILNILNDNKIISKFLCGINVGLFENEVKEVVNEWKDYVSLLDDDGRDKSIEFMTACKYYKIKTIQRYINKIKNNKKERIISLLSGKCKHWYLLYGDSKEIFVPLLWKIMGFKYNNKMKELLEILLFRKDNTLSMTDKMELLSQKGQTDGRNNKPSVLRYATNQARLLILNHFNDCNKKYFLKLLKTQNLLNYIIKSNDIESFNFIFYSSILNDKERLKLINSVNSGHVVIWKYMKNDRKIIQKKIKFDPKILFDACSNFKNKNNSNYIIEIIDFLRKDKKEYIKALSYTEKGDYHRGSDFGQRSHYYYSSLMEICENQKDGKIIKLILCDINNMNYEQQLKLLMMKDKYNDFDNESFIFKIRNEEHMKIVFSTLNNNVIQKLLQQKNYKNTSGIGGYTVQDKWRLSDDQYDNIHSGNVDTIYVCDTKYKLEKVISDCLEYLEFDNLLNNNNNNTEIDVSFARYLSNPFITSCYLGKYESIKKLLNNMCDNKEKLRFLLLNSFNKLNGNNCLMELAQNGYNNIIIDILNVLNLNNFNGIKHELLSMKNKYSAKTLLFYLSKNDSVNLKEIIVNS